MASQYTWLIPLYPSVLRGLFDLCSHYSKNYDNVKQGKIKKQQYKNRLNNAQGQHFEREILAGCRMYESHGIATIDKTPEPFRVTSKNHRTGEFTGRFSTHAQPDFQGTLYGCLLYTSDAADEL